MPRSAWLSLMVLGTILVLSNCEPSGRQARGDLEKAIEQVESVQKDFQLKTQNLERKVHDLRADGEQILAGARDATDAEDDSTSEGRAVETAQGEDEEQRQGGKSRPPKDSADEEEEPSIDLLGRKEGKKVVGGGDDAIPDEEDLDTSSRSKKQAVMSAEKRQDDDAADDEDAEKGSKGAPKGARPGSQKRGEQADEEESKSDDAEEEGRRGQSKSKKDDRDEEENADHQARKMRVKIVSPGFPPSSRNENEEREKDDMAVAVNRTGGSPKVRNATNTTMGADNNKDRANDNMNRATLSGEGRKQANATNQDGKDGSGSRQASAADGSKKEKSVRKVVDGEGKEPATVSEKAAEIGKMATNLSKIKSARVTPILTDEVHQLYSQAEKVRAAQQAASAPRGQSSQDSQRR